MSKETDDLDYVESVTGIMMRITDEHTARLVALDLWKYYPTEAQLLATALTQSQHTKQVPRLFQRGE